MLVASTAKRQLSHAAVQAFFDETGWFSPRLNGPPSAEVEVLPRLTIVPRDRCRTLLDGLPEGAVCALSDPAANVVCEWRSGATMRNCCCWCCCLLLFLCVTAVCCLCFKSSCQENRDTALL